MLTCEFSFLSLFFSIRSRRRAQKAAKIADLKARKQGRGQIHQGAGCSVTHQHSHPRMKEENVSGDELPSVADDDDKNHRARVLVPIKDNQPGQESNDGDEEIVTDTDLDPESDGGLRAGSHLEEVLPGPERVPIRVRASLGTGVGGLENKGAASAVVAGYRRPHPSSTSASVSHPHGIGYSHSNSHHNTNHNPRPNPSRSNSQMSGEGEGEVDAEGDVKCDGDDEDGEEVGEQERKEKYINNKQPRRVGDDGRLPRRIDFDNRAHVHRVVGEEDTQVRRAVQSTPRSVTVKNQSQNQMRQVAPLRLADLDSVLGR